MGHKGDKTIRFFGWLTVSPSWKPWFELDPYISPFGNDEQVVVIPEGHKVKKPITGWCSWYALGEDINEKNILENAAWLAKHKQEIPVQYVQIDDGWTKWGDWKEVDKRKFPQGLKRVVEEIKKMGFKAGIWLSPFMLDLESETAIKHPDWVIRDKKGKPVYGHPGPIAVPNILWKKRYVLNTHHPEAYKYLLECVDYLVTEVGFDLLKLDFMCGPYYDPDFLSPERADELIHTFLKYIHNCYPDVYTITGVAPIVPAAGLTDALRISDDIIVPPLQGKWPINALVHAGRLRQLEKNFKARKDLGKIWNLDPDVFVCRENLGFSDKQIEKLANIIRETKGLIFLGDDLTQLPEDRVQKYIKPLFIEGR